MSLLGVSVVPHTDVSRSEGSSLTSSCSVHRNSLQQRICHSLWNITWKSIQYLAGLTTSITNIALQVANMSINIIIMFIIIFIFIIKTIRDKHY